MTGWVEDGGFEVGDRAELRVDISGDGFANAEELSQAAQLLRDELLDLSVDDVLAVESGMPPVGAKGANFAVVGALLVRVARSRLLLRSVASAVAKWAESAGARSVRIELDGDVLEMKGLSFDQQQVLIDSWVQRHGPGGT